MKLFFIPGTISAKDLRDEVTTLSAIGLTKDKIKKAELKSPALYYSIFRFTYAF